MVSTSGCHYHEDCSSHEDCICACCSAGYCNLGKCICDPFKRKRALSEPFSRDIYTGGKMFSSLLQLDLTVVDGGMKAWF